MTDTTPTYRIVSRVHVNRWVDDLQAAVPGWELKAQWFPTGTFLPVFVADANYTPDNVDAIIRAAGARDERIHALGA
jgi:hypothetical protein